MSKTQIEPQAMAILVGLARRARRAKRQLRRGRRGEVSFTRESEIDFEARENEAWNALQASKQTAISFKEQTERCDERT